MPDPTGPTGVALLNRVAIPRRQRASACPLHAMRFLLPPAPWHGSASLPPHHARVPGLPSYAHARLLGMPRASPSSDPCVGHDAPLHNDIELCQGRGGLGARDAISLGQGPRPGARDSCLCGMATLFAARNSGGRKPAPAVRGMPKSGVGMTPSGVEAHDMRAGRVPSLIGGVRSGRAEGAARAARDTVPGF